MKFSNALFLLASTLVPTATIATSLGAGGCVGGQAAATGHGGASSGDAVEDGGYTLSAMPTENADEYVVTLSGPDFKGFLFRTELGTDIVDAGIGQEASACEGTAMGVTHKSPDLKTEATATFMAPAGAESATIDVTVVKAFSDYYYTGLTVDLTAAAPAMPGASAVDPMKEQLDRIEKKLDMLLAGACVEEEMTGDSVTPAMKSGP